MERFSLYTGYSIFHKDRGITVVRGHVMFAISRLLCSSPSSFEVITVHISMAISVIVSVVYIPDWK